jgi:alkaline phosphatase
VDVSRRLALVFGAFPDHCDAGKPYVGGENVPTAKAPDGDTRSTNETYCVPDAARKIGNLPITAEFGVHAADDVVLTATGPGAEVFRGRIDNTRVFFAMARALGLGAERKQSRTDASNGQSTSAR